MTTAVIAKPNLEALRNGLRSALIDALGSEDRCHHIEYLCEPKDVLDDATKLVVSDAESREVAVVLVSSPVDPGIVDRGMRIAEQAKRVLGQQLGRAILEPLGEGVFCGLSYAILPFLPPMREGRIRRRFWRVVLRRNLLDWLAGVAVATSASVPDADIVDAFETPLAHVARLDGMNPSLKIAADRALQRLESAAWKPRFVLMHGDMWEGNILLAPRSRVDDDPQRGGRFVVIDWPGATLRGYAMYDLLRLAQSVGLSRAGLRHEVLRHCEILESEAVDAMGYLAAGIGYLGLNLGYFAPDRYLETSLTCCIDLSRALA